MQPNNPFSTTFGVQLFAGSDSSTMHWVCDKTVVNVQAHSFELWPEALLNMQACSPGLRSTPVDHASMFGGYQCATLSNHASMFSSCCYTKPRRARDHHDPAPNRLLSHSFQRIDIQHWTWSQKMTRWLALALALAICPLVAGNDSQRSLARASEIFDHASMVNPLQLETPQPCKHDWFAPTQHRLNVQAHSISAKGSKLFECASTLNQLRCTKPRHARDRHAPAPSWRPSPWLKQTDFQKHWTL